MPESAELERRMIDRREIEYLRNEVTTLNKEAKTIAVKMSNISATLRILLAVMLGGISLSLWIIQDTRHMIEAVDVEAHLQHSYLNTMVRDASDRFAETDNKIVRVQNIISLNQKRVMESLALPYMVPEPVR